MAFSVIPSLDRLYGVSASQLSNYDCPTRWWLSSIAKNQTPQTPEMALGEWAHSKTEDHLYGHPVQPDKVPPIVLDAIANGSAISVDTTFSSLGKLWADPSFPKVDPKAPQTKIEYPKDYKLGLEIDGVAVRGRIDLADFSSTAEAHVWDWKSSGNLDYAKTPDELVRETQIVIYAKWAFEKAAPRPSFVLAHHGYFKTKKGAGHRIVTTDPMDLDHVDGIFHGPISARVREMKDAAQERDWTKVPRNWGQCKAYNRLCPFWELCDGARSATSTQPPQEGTPTMSLAEKLKARPRATGINPPDASVPPAVERYVPVAQAPAPSVTVSATPGPGPTEATATVVTTATPGPGPGPTPNPLVLYVDCRPEKGVTDYLRLEDAVQARGDEIAHRYGVTDVREVEYGKGTAELIADFRKRPLTGVVVATSHGLSASVLEVLTPLASVIVRGVR